MAVFSAVMVTLFFTDLEEKILPDEFTLGGTLAGLLLAGFSPLQQGLVSLLLFQYPPVVRSVAESAVGAAMLGGILWLIGELYHKVRGREGLGLGDVKLAACIGSFLGLHGGLMSMIVGSVFGSVLGLGWIVFHRKDPSTYELPYGSFLGAAALFVGMFGEGIMKWYLQLGR